MFSKHSLIVFFVLLLPFFMYAQECITINKHPENQEVILNNNVVLTKNITIVLTTDATSSSALTFQWQIFNDSTNEWENINESTEFTGTTTNQLTVTNVNFVNNNDRVRVFISTTDNSCTPKPSNEAVITKINIAIHNFFTPNNDGYNDTFQITGIDNPLFQNNELKVFNRWGNAVYQATNYKNDWDGTANTGFAVISTKKVPMGTYFYTLDLNYRNIRLSGWVYVKL